MATRTERSVRRHWPLMALWVCAIVCLGWVGLVSGQAILFDRHARDAFRASRDADPLLARVSGVPILGILEIPRLGFSEVVADGDHESTLRVAIGHLTDTPLPWQPGNSALAGHRDGRFRALKDVRSGDRLQLETHHGTFDYVLRDTLIVEPDDVWVLDPTSTRTLTLITCYPFDYVGAAPRRFVLRAEAVGSEERAYESSTAATK